MSRTIGRDRNGKRYKESLKKPRSLFTDGKQVLYLDSYFKRFNYCAFFAEENEE